MLESSILQFPQVCSQPKSLEASRSFSIPSQLSINGNSLQVLSRSENCKSELTISVEMSLIPHFFGRRSDVFDQFSIDPFEGFRAMSGPLTGFPSESSAFVSARVDWKETPTAHVFKADVPGLKKEEMKVEIEDDRVLQISGERSAEKEERTDTWHRVERSSGRFVRRFRLPENAKVEQVKAAMENGVLTVTVPKAETMKPDVRSVQING
ncbi:hypothetical protein SAY86_005927 [Trapa natans]|uniref:SHSP domain-containing protein n=1 Tax=Trapa natans TaxID=22666 RepID=A0AAN7L4B7_TRANT|nr:hypothetical protein SAY86_005927 [Trapa natans]